MRLPLALLAFSVTVGGCAGGSPTSPPPSAGGPVAVLVGAGDIAVCNSPGAASTAVLLDGIPGTVFTTGDNAYHHGTAENFRECYHPTWGRHRTRTRPAPGNHDYEVPGATDYFEYFGANAGEGRLGYYWYRAGSWLVLSLNSEVPATAGSAQHTWLRQTLSANASTQCTLAYWHRPLFSSGQNGDSRVMADIWRLLQEYNAELVVTGHEHMYERFAPQNVDGVLDQRGLRQITAGTGGANLTQPRAPRPNSEVIGTEWGVLKLTLHATSYLWEFVPVRGATFSDFGSGNCN